MTNPYQVIQDFETELADFCGSKYAVAVDSCSSALFLSCKYAKVDVVTIPARTYFSVPCSIINAGGFVWFKKEEWQGRYQLEPYSIFDSACRLQRNMYLGGKVCVSFRYNKHLNIGRGGAILTDDEKFVDWAVKARYHGRDCVPTLQEHPTMLGWSMMMEPDEAARGLRLLSVAAPYAADLKFEYPDLSKMEVYK